MATLQPHGLIEEVTTELKEQQTVELRHVISEMRRDGSHVIKEDETCYYSNKRKGRNHDAL